MLSRLCEGKAHATLWSKMHFLASSTFFNIGIILDCNPFKEVSEVRQRMNYLRKYFIKLERDFPDNLDAAYWDNKEFYLSELERQLRHKYKGWLKSDIDAERCSEIAIFRNHIAGEYRSKGIEHLSHVIDSSKNTNRPVLDEEKMKKSWRFLFYKLRHNGLSIINISADKENKLLEAFYQDQVIESQVSLFKSQHKQNLKSASDIVDDLQNDAEVIKAYETFKPHKNVALATAFSFIVCLSVMPYVSHLFSAMMQHWSSEALSAGVSYAAPTLVTAAGMWGSSKVVVDDANRVELGVQRAIEI